MAERRREKVSTDGVELQERVVQVNRVAKVVKGGRRFSFSALVVVGNEVDAVGVGHGKANEVPLAIQKAVDDAKKNMFRVPRYGSTITHETIGHHGAGRVLLKPAAPGTGVIAGGGVRAVLELAGVRDILSKSLGTTNPVNLVSATVNGLKSLRTPEEVAALRGKTVAVLGSGASAFDNAAVALEHGATVDAFCRRRPTGVQRYRWLTFTGFLRHMGDMPDLWRWRFMGNILRAREGFPPDTYKRVMAFPDRFTLHTGRTWTDAHMEGDRVRIETSRGPFLADYLICGTGIRQDVHQRPELATFADQIALWSDRFTPPAGEEDPQLAAYPYLGPDYAFTEKVPGSAPFLSDIHVFGIGSTLSFGVSGSSINAMKIAVPKLVAGLTRGLFEGDLPRHWQSLLAYDTSLVDLDWSQIRTE